MSSSQKSYLPADWSDDQRMRVMFSEFRNRDINPTGWDSKLNFWKAAIREWSATSGQTEYSTLDVRNAFIRNGQTARCLDTVTNEMIKQGQLMTLEAFQKQTADQGWIGWSWDLLVQKPLGFTWSLIGSSFFASREQTVAQKFVNFELIKKNADLILQRHIGAVEAGKADATVSWDTLSKQCQDICKSHRDLELCLALLRKDRHLTVHEEQGQKIIKFAVTGKPVNATAKLSHVEKSIVQLRMVQKTLERQIELHESEVEKFTDEAKSHLKSGSRKLAKVALQKKRQSETLILKKEKTLDNIELMMNNLQDVDTQKAVLNALQAGSNAFKLTQISEGFDLDKVDETMANVQETLEMQSDLEHALSQPIKEDNDTAELEQELEDILGEGDAGSEEEEEEVPPKTQTVSPTTSLAQRLQRLRETDEPNFPEPPSHSPVLEDRGRVRLQH